MFAQKLKVLFAVGSGGDVSEPLEVSALSCDTVEQVKEKILATFKAKFGFSYATPLRELSIGTDLAGFLLTYRRIYSPASTLFINFSPPPSRIREKWLFCASARGGRQLGGHRGGDDAEHTEAL